METNIGGEGPELGLVAKDRDPREPRRMVAWLTPRGQEVVSRLLKVARVKMWAPQ